MSKELTRCRGSLNFCQRRAKISSRTSAKSVRRGIRSDKQSVKHINCSSGSASILLTSTRPAQMMTLIALASLKYICHRKVRDGTIDRWRECA